MIEKVLELLYENGARFADERTLVAASEQTFCRLVSEFV